MDFSFIKQRLTDLGFKVVLVEDGIEFKDKDNKLYLLLDSKHNTQKLVLLSLLGTSNSDLLDTRNILVNNGLTVYLGN